MITREVEFDRSEQQLQYALAYILVSKYVKAINLEES